MTKFLKSSAGTLTETSLHQYLFLCREDELMIALIKTPKAKEPAVPRVAPLLARSKDQYPTATSLTGQHKIQQQDMARLKFPTPALSCWTSNSRWCSTRQTYHSNTAPHARLHSLVKELKSLLEGKKTNYKLTLKKQNPRVAMQGSEGTTKVDFGKYSQTLKVI